MKIVYIVGSLSEDSINRRLANELRELAPQGVEMVEASIKDLPLYSRDYDSDFPQVARDFKDLLSSADGVILVTPEHNRSFSAPLHNAIEWSSRPYGEWALGGKVIATIGASPSGIGTAAGQQSLRAMLQFFNVKLMGQPEGYINALTTGLAEGEANADAKEFLKSWIEAFVDFVNANTK
ncbi:chromate reductase [Arcanobacterium pluranimalium]|uniref:NADPH-dependent FMN reductase n=1 Tax=Arcanobacterium pluranimalium TaxID=108028 RepID=UPI00195AB0B1|nr:NADPH-dependent FMN reductase [Arcanobacterium pluranimalium]MBM7825211.1 chromate reductase [Arcanobacterium pluranimalium]